MALKKVLSALYLTLLLVASIIAFRHYGLVTTKTPKLKTEIENLDTNRIFSILSLDIKTEKGKIQAKLSAYRSFLKPTQRKLKITLTLENPKGEIVGIAEKTMKASPGQIINTTLTIHTREKGPHTLKLEIKTNGTVYKTKKNILIP